MLKTLSKNIILGLKEEDDIIFVNVSSKLWFRKAITSSLGEDLMEEDDLIFGNVSSKLLLRNVVISFIKVPHIVLQSALWWQLWRVLLCMCQASFSQFFSYQFWCQAAN
ncbi:hypothetical protein CEXT_757951 [Caerostris extrusa]|uniref:Uncharacterized protein n=1 Tax=Caerostris extrusa TaxID=172846 RepID=A0AAV4M8R3_CAEEX|nr:hypothetical protein CEXT_757951 [Caerostris extrusa]